MESEVQVPNMMAIEYVERIRKAYTDNDYQEIERLEREYGTQEVSFKELEEVVSFDTQVLLEYLLEIDSKYEEIINKVLTTLERRGILGSDEREAIENLEDEGDE